MQVHALTTHRPHPPPRNNSTQWRNIEHARKCYSGTRWRNIQHVCKCMLLQPTTPTPLPATTEHNGVTSSMRGGATTEHYGVTSSMCASAMHVLTTPPHPPPRNNKTQWRNIEHVYRCYNGTLWRNIQHVCKCNARSYNPSPPTPLPRQTYACTYTYAYTRISKLTQKRTFTFRFTYTLTIRHTYTHTYSYTHTFTHVHSCTHTNPQANKQTSLQRARAKKNQAQFYS